LQAALALCRSLQLLEALGLLVADFLLSDQELELWY
jgi:hypothetical protein